MGTQNSSKWNGFNPSEGAVADKSEKTRTQALAESGLDYLRQGDFEKAQQVFNTALKFDMKSVPLHFFNALTYQLKHEKGDPESFKLAEAGYRTAILLDPTMDLAHQQLGKLYLSVNRYTEAQQSFAQAVDSKPGKPQEALFGLARASLLAGDSASSAWAVKKLEDAGWNDSRLWRLKAFQAAVVARPEQAKEMLGKYMAQEENAVQKRYVDARVNQILAVKTSMGRQLVGDVLLAQAKAEDAKAEEKGKAEEKKEEVAEPRKNWFSCDVRPAPIVEKDATPMAVPTPGAGGDEGWVTYTLPLPCDGKNPPVAMIEVTMVRTEEKDTQTYGINLLEGLKVAGALRYTDGALSSTFRTRSIYTDAGAADPITGGILSYSLNIANALYEKNEVVARPTLAAIDRLPSVFFSGATYSVQVGSANTGFTLADKSVGISLSVTPTFVNDEDVLLSIRASRSFLEDSADPTSPIKLTQTRNTVNANALVKYGETFVLNGLIEREKDKIQSGTPLFQEIPILQYFFKKSITVDYNRQILTMVTVRRMVDNDAEIAKAKNKKGLISMHKLAEQVDEFVTLQNAQPVLDEVLSSLSKDNGLYKRLKARDLIQESISSKGLIERIIQDVKDMMYF